MTLNEIRVMLDATILAREDAMDMLIERAYCADLMSDVLAFSVTNSLLITGLTNNQVIRTAEVANIQAIIFIQDKTPDITTIALAEERKIPLMVTGHSMFDTCGRLYEKGLRSQFEAGF